MDKISFTVNGEHYTLSGSEVSPMTSLNEYLRNYLQLYGTKFMCREGGCGACVVAVSQTHPLTKEKHTFSVNSCLVHILSCHQWDITTVEGIGNQKDGYHPVQTRLAAFNGTQCGYCTPGWVMNMYSLLEKSKDLSMLQVERSFGGNLCRCTGYRPILDAFKSFAVNADPALRNRVEDLEDLHKVKCKKNCAKRCSTSDDEWCIIENKEEKLMHLKVENSRWYKAFTVDDVFKVLSKEGVNDYRFVAGNTGVAVFTTFWAERPRVLLDISSIESLKTVYVDANLVIGAGTTLTELMELFSDKSSEDEFKYLAGFNKHLDLVAHVPVRNIGTIGGNLAMKNAHHEFQSDIFLLLETVQAVVTLVSSDKSERILSMQDFLKADLTGKLITNVKLPPLSARCLIQSYKIMPRAQNALAIVNAGFFFKVDSANKIEVARLVYSNISPTFVRATGTESALIGLDLFSESTLQKALKGLNGELAPTRNPPEASPLCKKYLALGLLYKAILSLAPESLLNPRYKSGATLLSRGVSRGTQAFDTDKTLWPLNQPVPKIEALKQCSGEVKYSCDVVPSRREVQVSFVLSTICRGEIDRIDATEAMKMPGVIAVFTAKDIPGKNSFVPLLVPWQKYDEELLASKDILYYGQPVALVAATTHTLAITAADMVKVYYKKSNAKPVLSIKDAFNAPDKNERIQLEADIKPTSRGLDPSTVIKGTFSMPSQYHFTMETQSCAVTHTDDGLLVRSATQWMDFVQIAVANVLAVDCNKVIVAAGRLGGGYGGKATRAAQTACACALVAQRLRRDATLVMPLAHNMLVGGKRQPFYAEYEVGVNNDGVIQYLEMSYYSDSGSNRNDSSGYVISLVLRDLYDSQRWTVKGYSVHTDKPPNTWCRAPAATEAIALMEHIMERIAFTIKKDPIAVRKLNIAPKHSTVGELMDSFRHDTDYDDRKLQIAKFNSENAWKKRGLKLAIMSYPMEYPGSYPVTISVYHGDGTISIAHGGIEMGQGINTKVVQVCAYTLKVPMEKISIVTSNSFISPNSIASAGSITSECVAYATTKACSELLDRLNPVRNELNNPTWEELIKAAYKKNVTLQSSYTVSPRDGLQPYDVYGVCVAEVELDALTGQHALARLDQLEDTGVSLSPALDVGQIEGAFMMGLGLWTSEQIAYDESSGRILTARTWTYHPPGACDVPADMRVTFRRHAPNPAGVLRSKATGEPALTLAVTVCHALRDAILEARKEFGYDDVNWFDVEPPYSVENILMAISPKYESFKLQ